jgi:hypothetical protein
VFILWAWTAVLAGFVLAPTYTNEGNALVPFGIAALALVLYAIFHPTARQARRAAGVVMLDPDLVVLLDPDDDAIGAEEREEPPRAAPGVRG